MNNKLVGVVVCTLLIAMVVPVTGIMNDTIPLKERFSDYYNVKRQTTTGVMGSWWMQNFKLTASDGVPDNCFGRSVSISGEYAIVGAPGGGRPGAPNVIGAAYVFKRTGTTWAQTQKLQASDGTVTNYFGCSVSIDGDYAIIGADGDGGGNGAAYIFKRTGTTWAQTQKLVPSDPYDFDYFGEAVSISGDYAAVGVPAKDGIMGAVYIFKRTGTTWTQTQKLVAPNRADFDAFGYSVSLSGEYMFIGAPIDPWVLSYKPGAVYIFKLSGSTWTQDQKLYSSGSTIGDFFGYSVSISGGYAVVGAIGDMHSPGAAYVLQKSGSTWSEEAKLVASDGAPDDKFGSSVSISGDYIPPTVVVGAPGDDDRGSDSGSVYVFQRNWGPTWTQEQKLLASDGAADDKFGYAVSIEWDYAIIGAYGDNSYTGSAYTFRRGLPLLFADGTLQWSGVKTGNIIDGELFVQNIGDENTELDWEITEWPDWGNWTFEPQEGTDLTPEDDPLYIHVIVTAPDEKNTEFTGEVMVVNRENPDNCCFIEVYLYTSINRQITIHQLPQKILGRFPVLARLLHHES